MVKLNDLQKHELRDWSNEIEEILRNLSEKAQIWRLLHMKNHDIFKRKYYWLIIPVTILSSVTGAANLALGSVASGNETVINLVIGALGIIISVISTLNNIFSFQKRKDDHFRAAKDWYRVQRMIDIELSLQKTKRNNVSVFFHLVLQEIERIHEFHPNIRNDVVNKFMKKYKNKKMSIDIPEILSIRKTIIFKEDLTHETKSQNINISKKPNIFKVPTVERQGTFIDIDDDSEHSNKSDSGSTENKERKHSFVDTIKNKINTIVKPIDHSQSNSKSYDSYYSNEILNVHNLHNVNDVANHSNNVSLTILEERDDNEPGDNEQGDEDENKELYPFELHEDNQNKNADDKV
uniref:SMODS and SLOG-associating 2TM effector domain-containing protein n=1 Tax=viral metagenome TaxID=1070528 RepID=A0A6C0I5A5_9ZZZZ